MSKESGLTTESQLENTHEFSFKEFKRNSLVKSKRSRTKIRSIGDVLDVVKNAGREGVIVSIISRRANLAHNVALEKCEKLISAGLIESKIFDKKKVYIITEKGLEFFNEYGKFQNIIESLNLKY